MSDLAGRVRTWLQAERGYALLLFLLGFLAYLAPLTRLGFYWDDWEVVYLTRLADPKILEQYFFFDRPLAWPYPVYYALIGSIPFLWHLLTLVLRWGGVFFFYRAFSLLWPKNTSALRWFGLILMVYPGFLQQPIAAAFSRHFTSFFLCGLSFYLTALAFRSERKNLFWLLALLTGAAQMFTIEYFAGLELARPLLIWFLLAGLPWRQRLGRVGLFWLPFAGVFAAFAAWRVAVYPALLKVHVYASSASLLSGLRAAPLDAALGLFKTIFLDSTYLLYKTWLAYLTDPAHIDLRASSLWFAALLGGGIAALAFYLYRGNDGQTDEKFSRQAILLGFALLLFGGVPVWVIGRAVDGGGLWDNRFAISMMVGAVLVVVGLAHALVNMRWQPWLLAGLLAVSITSQAMLVNTYRREWSNQRDFFWQLAWRAPTLQPGTPILSIYVPSPTLPDYDAAFAITLLYSGQPTGSNLPFWYYNWETIDRLHLKPGKELHTVFRNLVFTGSVDHSLVLMSQPLPGCLRIISPVYADDPAIGRLTSLLPYADPQRILPTQTVRPAAAIFGSEPAPSWCYYFQKADLARQLGQWDQVKGLYQQAEKSGFSPAQGGEYLPLIEALAQTGEMQTAYQVSKQAAALTDGLDVNLCANWLRYSRLPGAAAGITQQAQREFACP